MKNDSDYHSRLLKNLFWDTDVQTAAQSIYRNARQRNSKPASQTDRQLTEDLPMLCEGCRIFLQGHICLLYLTLKPGRASSPRPVPGTGKHHAMGWQG